jgi:hypothetical protein
MWDVDSRKKSPLAKAYKTYAKSILDKAAEDKITVKYAIIEPYRTIPYHAVKHRTMLYPPSYLAALPHHTAICHSQHCTTRYPHLSYDTKKNNFSFINCRLLFFRLEHLYWSLSCKALGELSSLIPCISIALR